MLNGDVVLTIKSIKIIPLILKHFAQYFFLLKKIIFIVCIWPEQLHAISILKCGLLQQLKCCLCNLDKIFFLFSVSYIHLDVDFYNKKLHALCPF